MDAQTALPLMVEAAAEIRRQHDLQGALIDALHNLINELDDKRILRAVPGGGA